MSKREGNEVHGIKLYQGPSPPPEAELREFVQPSRELVKFY